MARLFLINALHRQAHESPALLRVLWAVENAVVRVLAGVCLLLGPDRASRAGRRLFRAIGPRMEKTKKIHRNLSVVFPEKAQREIEQLAREVWGSIGAALSEYPHLGRICLREADKRVEVIDKSDTTSPGNAGKPAIFVTAHLCNLEIATGTIVHRGIPFTGVYTPIQNPGLDKLLHDARAAFGCELVKREGAVRKFVQSLKRGRSIGLVVDQRVDEGELVPFFGHDMNTSITPAKLALRLGCDLVPVQVQRLEGARFRVIFHAPLKVQDPAADENAQILQMTRQINSLFENWIRERPHEWMCTKRRWSKDLDPAPSRAASTPNDAV